MRITSQSDLIPPCLLLWIKNKYFYETFPGLIIWLKQLDLFFNFFWLVDAGGTEITDFTLNVYFFRIVKWQKSWRTE